MTGEVTREYSPAQWASAHALAAHGTLATSTPYNRIRQHATPNPVMQHSTQDAARKSSMQPKRCRAQGQGQGRGRGRARLAAGLFPDLWTGALVVCLEVREVLELHNHCAIDVGEYSYR